MSALDTQVGGKAYSKTYPEWPIQPVEFIHKNGIDFIRGCVIKYVCRDRFKNGHEDLLKARHYIDLLLELDNGKAEEKTISEETQPNLTGLFREAFQTKGCAGETIQLYPGYGQLGT